LIWGGKQPDGEGGGRGTVTMGTGSGDARKEARELAGGRNLSEEALIDVKRGEWSNNARSVKVIKPGEARELVLLVIHAMDLGGASGQGEVFLYDEREIFAGEF